MPIVNAGDAHGARFRIAVTTTMGRPAAATAGPETAVTARSDGTTAMGAGATPTLLPSSLSGTASPSSATTIAKYVPPATSPGISSVLRSVVTVPPARPGSVRRCSGRAVAASKPAVGDK